MSATPLPAPAWPILLNNVRTLHQKNIHPILLFPWQLTVEAVGIGGSRRQAKSLEWEAYRSVTSAPLEKQHIILYYCTLSSLFLSSRLSLRFTVKHTFISVFTHTRAHGHTYTMQTGLQHQTCVIFLLEHDHEQPPRQTTLHLFLFPAAAGEGQPVLGCSKGLRQHTHHVTLIPPCLLLPHFSQSGWGMRLCMYVSVYGPMCIFLSFRAGRHVCFKPTLLK